MIKADGFDEAIVGFAQMFGKDGFVIVYNASKMVEILMERDEMTYEEAVEYFEYNIQGAYVGENTPIYMFPADLQTIEEMAEELDG